MGDAIHIYLDLHDKSRDGTAGAEADNGDGKETEISAAEKKKLKHKKNRDKKKAEEEQAAKTTTTTGGKPKKVDDDPEGEKFLEKDALEEASKLVKTLVLYCDNDVATHVLTYDVFRRQGKLLHCLQALLRIWNLSGCNVNYYKLIESLAHFCFVADLENEETPSAVREVVMAEAAPMLRGGEETPFANVAELRSAAS